MIKIGENTYTQYNPYIIAEIGVNHAGDIELAKKMIKSIAIAGGNAAKFQSYKAEKIASQKSSPSYWDTSEESCSSQFELFKKFDSFGRREYQELAKYCKEVGVDFLSTPFDLDAVDELEDLVPCYKIASADITNISLVRKIANKGKPVILSTGASNLYEIENAMQILEKTNCPQITLLHCVLNYPTPVDHAQMNQLDTLQKIFGGRATIGYSDHVKTNLDGTMPSLEIATIRGSVILEKHFTYDKTLSGNDHYHAMNENDLRNFVQKLKIYKLLAGSKVRNLEWERSAIINARRRILLAKSIKKGEIITEEHLIALRSNTGIETIHWDSILGKRCINDLKENSVLTWRDIE